MLEILELRLTGRRYTTFECVPVNVSCLSETNKTRSRSMNVAIAITYETHRYIQCVTLLTYRSINCKK